MSRLHDELLKTEIKQLVELHAVKVGRTIKSDAEVAGDINNI